NLRELRPIGPFLASKVSREFASPTVGFDVDALPEPGVAEIWVLEPETLTVRTSIPLWPEPHETTVVLPIGRHGGKEDFRAGGPLPRQKE
ncbi:MAG: hypothetical protein IH801_06700, partial [Nitrospinae bacterium]|nr:hypothetical protein [Nitrospinota bacterium]